MPAARGSATLQIQWTSLDTAPPDAPGLLAVFVALTLGAICGQLGCAVLCALLHAITVQARTAPQAGPALALIASLLARRMPAVARPHIAVETAPKLVCNVLRRSL